QVGGIGDDPVPPESAHLVGRGVRAAVVVDPHVGNAGAGGIVGLGSHPGLDLLAGHPPVPLQPFGAGAAAGPDDEHQVVLGGQVVLHDQGDVVHHHCVIG